MKETMEPIKPDYSKAWVRGEEHIGQEGTGFWQRKREQRGWSREDVYELTDFVLDPLTLGLIEGDYGCGGVWDMRQLIDLAHLYGESPGAMLDQCFEEMGRELMAED